MLTSHEMYQKITPKTKKKRIFIILFVLILFGICMLLYLFLQDSKKVVYNTIKPIRGDITQTVSATGTLSPTNELEVGSQISGTIYKLYVEVNDSVKENQILAEINPNKLMQIRDGYEAQLQSALASLESSKLTMQQKEWHYTRQKKLYEVTQGKSPSMLELENAKMDYLAAKADVKIKQASIHQIQTNLHASKIDLQNAIIRSPIDGIVLERAVSVGSTVAASFSSPMLFRLAQDLKDMSLVINISESDIGKVQVGQDVQFSVDAYPNQIFHAKVDRVNFAATTTDNITSYETTIYVNNSELLLKPGMNATAFIQVAKEENALLVPVSAIYYTPEQQDVKQQKKTQNPLMVTPQRPKKEKTIHQSQNERKTQIWILKDGIAQSVMVRLGISDSKMFAIFSDELDEESEIITGTYKQ